MRLAFRKTGRLVAVLASALTIFGQSRNLAQVSWDLDINCGFYGKITEIELTKNFRKVLAEDHNILSVAGLWGSPSAHKFSVHSDVNCTFHVHLRVYIFVTVMGKNGFLASISRSRILKFLENINTVICQQTALENFSLLKIATKFLYTMLH